MSRPARRFGIVALVLVTLATVAVVWSNSAEAGRQAQPSAQPAVPPAAPATVTAPLVTPVLSARRAPELLRSTISDSRIRGALQPVLDQAPANSCVVVTNGGRAVIARNLDKPMVPASTEKLLTGAALLEEFGLEHRLATVVGATTPPSDGVVEGDLYLIGGGDPLLTTPGYKITFENPDQLMNDYAQLADRIVAAGVREVRGGVVGDESRYDGERWIPTWPERYQREGYVGPLSALMVNDGNTGLTERPDEAASSRRPGDPPSLAAATLITLLKARGVTVTGGASAGVAPADMTEITRLESLPMRELIGEMIADSDNTTAELLVKELAVANGQPGTTAAGLEVIASSLAAERLPVEGISLRDGSGLDPQNQLTCELLAAALDLHGPDSVLGESLPIAGETGTLRRRMRGTPAQGKVRAKTGTLSEVHALAGFAETQGGASLTFAYLINGPEPRGYQPIDDLAAALVGVPDGPPVADLEPLPAGA
jgi:D-alanyl-D-alanine carboxypeptidase/D-alanyl-D-alanine-endopeptidase (penicillin-binding protein 4)